MAYISQTQHPLACSKDSNWGSSVCGGGEGGGITGFAPIFTVSHLPLLSSVGFMEGFSSIVVKPEENLMELYLYEQHWGEGG